MASVRASIIGRPRRLPPYRRAHPDTSGYTRICEERLTVVPQIALCDRAGMNESTETCAERRSPWVVFEQ